MNFASVGYHTIRNCTSRSKFVCIEKVEFHCKKAAVSEIFCDPIFRFKKGFWKRGPWKKYRVGYWKVRDKLAYFNLCLAPVLL